MTTLKNLAGLSTLALALFCTDALAQDLSGRWYGEGYQGRGYLQWIATRKQDGSFFVEFRQYKECQLTFRQLEAGRWFLRNGVYSTVTAMIDGKRVDYNDSYVLESLENGVMQYRHLKHGKRFAARRVGDDFDWPACDASKLVS